MAAASGIPSLDPDGVSSIRIDESCDVVERLSERKLQPERIGVDQKDNSQKLDKYVEAPLYAAPCDVCQITERNSTSSQSIQFWRTVEETLNSSTNCHVKYYVYFMRKLVDTFPNEPGLRNRKVVNLLQMILQVQGTNDTKTVSLENFSHAVKCFGPVAAGCERCTLIKELETLCVKSLQYRDKSKKEKISWFAGFMTHEDAETRLSCQKDSTFLVRNSPNTDQGGFVVSVKHDGIVYHFEIETKPELNVQGEIISNRFLFNGKLHTNLPALVDDMKYNIMSPEDEDIDILCRIVCPGLPFNSIMSGYSKTKKTQN